MASVKGKPRRKANAKSGESASEMERFPFFTVLAEAEKRPFPWQESIWNSVLERATVGRLPQSWLLEGQAGLGKLCFAYWWMQWLHCQNVQYPQSVQQPLNSPRSSAMFTTPEPTTPEPTAPEQCATLMPRACGQCSTCVQVRANTHADCHWVRPEQVGGQIKIDQVRDVIRLLSQTAKHGANRVVVVEPVEAMNTAAQNALLKTLEEPGVGTYFFLISHRPVSVLPTIISRCQRLRFAVPTAGVVRSWLEQLPESVLPPSVSPEVAFRALPSVSGSPLMLLSHLSAPWFSAREDFMSDLEALGEDVSPGSGKKLSDVVEKWLEWPAVERVGVVIQRAQALIRTVMQERAWRSNLGAQAALQQAFALYDELMALYQLTVGANSINDRLLWEKVVITWEKLLRSVPR